LIVFVALAVVDVVVVAFVVVVVLLVDVIEVVVVEVVLVLVVVVTFKVVVVVVASQYTAFLRPPPQVRLGLNRFSPAQTMPHSLSGAMPYLWLVEYSKRLLHRHQPPSCKAMNSYPLQACVHDMVL
jgi:hypothetical protein